MLHFVANLMMRLIEVFFYNYDGMLGILVAGKYLTCDLNSLM